MNKSEITRLFTPFRSFFVTPNYWLFAATFSTIVLILSAFDLIIISEIALWFILVLGFLSIGVYDILKGQQSKSDA